MNKSLFRLLLCMLYIVACDAMELDALGAGANGSGRKRSKNQALLAALRDGTISVSGPHHLTLSYSPDDPKLWAMRIWSGFSEMQPFLDPEQCHNDRLQEIADQSIWLTGLPGKADESPRKKEDHKCSLLSALAWTASFRPESAAALAFFAKRGLLPTIAAFQASGYDRHPQSVIQKKHTEQIHPGSCCDSHANPLKPKELWQLLTRMQNDTFERIQGELSVETILNTRNLRAHAFQVMVQAALKGGRSYASFIACNVPELTWGDLGAAIRESKVRNVNDLRLINDAYPFIEEMPLDIFLGTMVRLGTPMRPFDYIGMNTLRPNVETGDKHVEVLQSSSRWVLERLSNAAFKDWFLNRYVLTNRDQCALICGGIARTHFYDCNGSSVLRGLFKQWKDNLTHEQKEAIIVQLRRSYGPIRDQFIKEIEASLPPKPSILSRIGASLLSFVPWGAEDPNMEERIAEKGDANNSEENDDSSDSDVNMD